ncbi:MAG: LysM peptidoglycan-binding domain-containing protein [Proteobacteria bacterium]|nr:LysM peptidoglycan-binding domain-containing protein [Pseudomonadota bacterium]
MTIILSRRLAALAAALFILFGAWPARGAEDPTISLVKTIIVREYQGRKIDVEEYVVESGDILTRILQRRRVVGEGPIPRDLLALIQALNPDLKDPDLIHVGQKLFLPVEGVAVEAEGPATGPKEKAAVEPPAKIEEKAAAKPPAGPEVKPAAPPPVSPDETRDMKFKSVKVRPGERLALILRRVGIPEHLIFNEYINLTIKINPQLKNPNLILAGQEIKVPLPGTWSESELQAATGSGPIPARAPSVPPTATRVSPEPAPRPQPRPAPKLAVTPPPMPPSNSLAVRAALGLIFTRIGERFINRGQHFLPLKSGGQITINTQSFPIIELRTGRRVLLDLDHRLPEDMVALIRSNWANYTIFRPQPGEGLTALLKRLIEMSQYYKVREDGTPWRLSREIGVRISADWIIWPSAADWQAGRAVVINLPQTPAQGTSPEVAAYLETQGLKIIDFYPRGNLIGPEPRRDSIEPQLKTEEMAASDFQDFTRGLLDLVGQKFESDLSIPLIRNGESGADFNFTVQAPIYLTRGGANYVIDFQRRPPSMEKLLEEHHFRLITREAGERPEAFALKLFQALGLETNSGLNIQSSSRPNGRGIEITVPGALVHAPGGKLLLTSIDLPREIAPLLARKGLRVVRYVLGGAGGS